MVLPRPPARIVSAAGVMSLPLLLAAQQPTFRTGVELVRLDVTAVLSDGSPVPDLTPADFEVSVSGAPRRVVSAQFHAAAGDADTGAPVSAPGGFSSNSSSGRRLFLVVVDEMNLVPGPADRGKERPFVEALRDFVASLAPRDRVAVITVPGKTARVDFTDDPAVLRAAVDRIRAWAPGDIPRESISLERGEGGTTAGSALPIAADTLNRDFETTVDLLCAIAKAVTPIEGPKTLMLVSGRLPGGAGELATSQKFARAAAEARLQLYAVRYLAVPGEVMSGTGSNAGPDDPLTGFHLLAGTSGGAVFDAVARAKGVFERIDRESSGSYVLGIEPPSGTAPSAPLEVVVRVRRPGVMIRSRTQVLLPTPNGRIDTNSAVKTALPQPRPATGLPVRVATYAARGADPAKMKTVIVADVPALGAGDEAAWGYDIKQGGKPVNNALDRWPGQPVPTALTTAVELPAGTYALRLAVATTDGRVGSVEHSMVVAAHGTPAMGFSDLFVGQAVEGRFQPRISIGRSADAMVAFVELYAPDGQFTGAAVDFEIEGPEGPTGAAVPASLSGSGTKRVAQAVVPLEGLEPGRYEVTAAVRSGTTELGSVRRAFMLER